MSAHLLEAPVVAPLAADEDRVHRRLHVVVDAALAGPAQERERAVVRVEHHLLALARIRPHIEHPAVTEPQVSGAMTMLPRSIVPIIRGMIGGPTPLPSW